MTEGEDQAELLFFDTFSHEVNTDVNLDLVQFPKPVNITHIRIIPLGARVEADFPGGVRLGATNPSKFDIDFFVNDLGIQSAATFEILGHMKYNQNDCIHLECEQGKLTTDGLVLRGWYSTITLAVYGVTRETINEPIASPPPLQPTEAMEPNEELCSTSNSKKIEPRRRNTADDDDDEEDWKEPLTSDLHPIHKNSTSDYERDDLDYGESNEGSSTARRDHHYHHHSGDERRLRKTSRSSEHSRDSSKHRTISENAEREYLRTREKNTRDWSRSPDYASRHSRRRRSERSRSDADEPHAKWPRTPPASIESPLRPRSPDTLLAYDDDDVVCTDEDLSRSDLRFKLKTRPTYVRQSRESLADVTSSTDVQVIEAEADEAPGTPIEQFEPILSDDEIIGDDDDGDVVITAPDVEETDSNALNMEEFEMEIQAAAANAGSVTLKYDPMKMPLSKYCEIDWHTYYSKELDNLRLLFKKFDLQTKCNNLQTFKSNATTTDERESFVFLSEQLINQLNFLAQQYRRRNIVLQQFYESDTKYLEMSYNILRIALDFETANSQPQHAFKIRHIKIGARLMELLGTCPQFVDYILNVQQFEPFHAILELYNRDYMALSIKLMLLKAIYALLDTKLGLAYFLGSEISGYRLILNTLQSTQLTRTKYALQAIIQKLNLREALDCIREQSTQLFVLTNVTVNAQEAYHLVDLAIEQILEALTMNGLSYQQPRRFLPVSKKFEIVLDAAAQRSFANTLQAFFSQNCLADSLLLILSNASELPPFLVLRTLDLLAALMQTNVGIDYLIDDCFETTRMLVAVLLGLDDVPKGDEEQDGLPTPPQKSETPFSCEVKIEGKMKEHTIAANRTHESGASAGKVSPIFTEKTNVFDNNVQVERLDVPTPKSPKKSDFVADGTASATAAFTTKNDEKDTMEIQLRGKKDGRESETTVPSKEELSAQPVCHRMQKLGIELAFKVQIRYHLDAIAHIATSSDYNALKLATHLHALYSHICCDLGRPYTVELLGLNNNFQIFMDLIKKEQRLQNQLQLTNASAKYKSAVLMYTVDLLDGCLRYSDNLNYLIEHGSELLDLSKNHETFEPSVSAVLQEMFVYLKPLEAINIFGYDDITALVEVITRSLEYITTFPGDLIMGLRILRHLAIGPMSNTAGGVGGGVGGLSHSQKTEQLKYRFVALQFYAADGVQTLLHIMEKLCNYFEQPGLHTPALAGAQGLHCCQIMLPTLQILHEMLAYAIQCRDVEFKDLTAIDPLMRTYILLHNFPISCIARNEADLAKKEIVRLLLAYTQPHEQDELLLHKSLWTLMIRDVLKNIDSPHTFIPGLHLLSELLPLPLPMALPSSNGSADVENQQIQRLITDRKLWSAHLHPQSTQIVKLIESIAVTSYAELSGILLRVCVQLADLAPNMTLLVSKTFVDLLCAEWTASSTQKPPSNSLVRLLEYFSRLTTYSSLKSSALAILTGKFCDLFHSILTLEDTSPVAIQCQIHILNIFKNFMDIDISLIALQVTSTPEINLASALPPKEIIPRIVDSTLSCYFKVQCHRTVFSYCARNLVMLSDHDITFYHVTSWLQQKATEFRQWMSKIVESNEATYCTESILHLVGLLKSLVSIPDTKQLAIPKRTLKLSYLELAKLIGFNKEDTTPSALIAANIIERLYNIFEKVTKTTNVFDGEDIVEMYDFVKKLKYQFEALDAEQLQVDGANDADGSTEPQLPQAESIVMQYAKRPIFTLIDGSLDPRSLSIDYWMKPHETALSPECIDKQCERIACDLSELALACLSSDINLTTDCKRVLHLSASPQSNRERTPTACFRTRRVEVEPTTGRPEKKPYITPVRGRGFVRPPVSRGDLFRSRPPNTSRPPSLHVDDFLALETCGAQPTGPTGYNKIPPIMRGSRGVRMPRGGRIGINSVYRNPKLIRTASPSIWNDVVHSPQSHYRTVNTGPDGSPHFGSPGGGPDMHYGASPHFAPRARGMRGLRTPRPYMR